MANITLDLHINLLKIFQRELSEAISDIREGRKSILYASKVLGELDNLCISAIEHGNSFCSGDLKEYEKIRAEVIQSLTDLDDYANMAKEDKNLSSMLN